MALSKKQGFINRHTLLHCLQTSFSLRKKNISPTANATRVVKARLRKGYPELDVTTAGVANVTKLFFSLVTDFSRFSLK